MRLGLDHHYSRQIAEGLRRRGHDVIAIVERGWQAANDEELLELCHAEQRALMTNNVADFAAISRRWLGEERSHHGLVYTSDASRPRNLAAIGRFSDDLDEFLTARPSVDALVDQTWWL